MEAGAKYTKDGMHLKWITELLGPLPVDLIKRGLHWRNLYTSTKTGGLQLKHFDDVSTMHLVTVLQNDHDWGRQEAEEFSCWLLPMLELRPEERNPGLEVVDEVEEVVDEVEEVGHIEDLESIEVTDHSLGQVAEVEDWKTGEALEIMINEDKEEAGIKKVAVKTTKIPLQVLRFGLSSKEISHVRASKHKTNPRLSPVDVIMERVQGHRGKVEAWTLQWSSDCGPYR